MITKLEYVKAPFYPDTEAEKIKTIKKEKNFSESGKSDFNHT